MGTSLRRAVLLAHLTLLHGWVSIPPSARHLPLRARGAAVGVGNGGWQCGRHGGLLRLAAAVGAGRKPTPPPPPPKRRRDVDTDPDKPLVSEEQIEKLDWEEKRGRSKASKGRTTAFHTEYDNDELFGDDLAPRDGLFYHDANGNLRKMKFSFDLSKGEGELEADEIYYDFMEQHDNSMKARKGSETWDEWRKRASDWMFFDQARVYVKGGDGGDGEVAYRREAHVELGGPFGGSGGKGGDVLFVADEGDNTLASVRSKLHMLADSGRRGQGKAKQSAQADDLTVRVPLGTIIRDEKTGVLVGDMRTPGQVLRVARGGKGGRGNWELKNEKNSVPNFAELGEKGQARWLELQLKLIADVGVVGVPNAGKSSFLASVTNAKPKIADYPFTTVVPNLGVCQLPGAERRSLVLADIPGLLEGAHDGIGLGQAFLRHIERCRVLLHIVDGSSADPLYDFKAIQNELEMFSPDLAQKPQVVCVNKMDLPEARARWPQLKEDLKALAKHGRIDRISAATNTNLIPILVKVRTMIDKMGPIEDDLGEETEAQLEAQKSLEAKKQNRNRRGKMRHEIALRGPGVWEIIADERLERLVRMTNFDYIEAEERFFRVLQASGVRELMEDAGCEHGDTVILAGKELEYREDRNMMQVLAKEDGYFD